MNHRRGIVAGFAAAGAVIVLSSAAFACTVWKGKAAVTNVTTGAGTAVAHGKNTGMEHCRWSPVGQTTAEIGETVNVAVSPHNGANVGPGGIKVGPCPASQLSNGWYDIRFVAGPAFTGDLTDPVTASGSYRNWLLDCMNGSVGTTLGELQVVGGSGNANVTLNWPVPYHNAPTDESAICVSGPGPNPNQNQGAAEGNQVPITITVI